MKNKLDKQLKFIELRAKGNSYDRISKELNVSKNTLIEWSRQNRKEIATLSNLEKDYLFDNYKLTKEHQIKSLGDQLAKIREEIANRDLSAISTDKLISLEMRLFDKVESLRSPTILYSDEEEWFMDVGSKWEG